MHFCKPPVRNPHKKQSLIQGRMGGVFGIIEKKGQENLSNKMFIKKSAFELENSVIKKNDY